MAATLVKITCAYCGKTSKKYLGHVNRANKIGAPVYCNKKCAGLGRRTDKTIEEKKIEKSAYDKEYRKKNIDWRMFLSAFQFTWDYQQNPEKYRQLHQKKMPKHLEYCRQPEYRKKKKSYDQRRVANKMYGEFAEAAIILRTIEEIVDNKQARFDKNCHNKAKKRKSLCKSSQRLT